MAIIIDEIKCIGCGSCVLCCPSEALNVLSTFVIRIDNDKCTDCMLCIDYCPNDAAKGV